VCVWLNSFLYISEMECCECC